MYLNTKAYTFIYITGEQNQEHTTDKNMKI